MTTDTAPTTLAQWLLSCIEADEKVARKASKQKVAGPLIRWGADSIFLTSGMFDRSERAHIARHDPARVLAECAAHRAIVETYLEVDHEYAATTEPSPMLTARRFAVLDVIEALASIYADRAGAERWVS